jgi:uncharacterized membrane protein YqaE (UPF0057 family)
MVVYDKDCKKDSECPSNVCEMTYDDAHKPTGRRCVVQKTRYGKKCYYNADCMSNRCVMTYNDKGKALGKRCVIIDGQKIPKRGWPYDNSGMPKGVGMSKQAKSTVNSPLLVSQSVKANAFAGNGPISEFIVIIMEIFIVILKMIATLMWDIWKIIFNLIYDLLFGSFRFGDLVGGVNKYARSQGTCIDARFIRYLITLMFPPAGVFMAKGINGFGEIMLCSLLTMCFYFPGLIYALINMRGEFNVNNMVPI